MSGVSGKPLSRVGKETWLKPIIHAIPTYVMSCFMLPVSTCDDMRRSLANQWWGVENGKKISIGVLGSGSLHPKIWGGMRFRDFKLFNQAMLGRQCWRLLTEPNSLCARVLKARYFPDYDFWEAPSPRSASYTWRSTLFGKKTAGGWYHMGHRRWKENKNLDGQLDPRLSPVYDSSSEGC